MPPPWPVAPTGRAEPAEEVAPGAAVPLPRAPSATATTTATTTSTATTAPITALLAPCRGAAAWALALRELLPLVMWWWLLSEQTVSEKAVSEEASVEAEGGARAEHEPARTQREPDVPQRLR